MEGFNCTVFAYGQTGTGKTHTMEGSRVLDGEYPHRDERNAGLLPRAVQHIFIKLYRSGVEEYSVRISHLELYNEHITDLLVCGTEDPEKLRIYDDEKTGTFVSGLTEVTVESEEEVMQILERSAKKRITAETEMNKFSSRSHSIFSITIHSKTASASDGCVYTDPPIFHQMPENPAFCTDLSFSPAALEKKTHAANRLSTFRSSS